MKTVGQLLLDKGYAIWSVGPDQTVYEALQLMAEKNVGALVVLESGQLVGMFSERDYARKVILKGRASRDTPVRDIMTSEVIHVRPDQTIEDCMTLMTEWRIRHLPVLEDGRLIGIVSIGDVVKSIITEQASMIEHLESYILQG